jgi:hypothetical protein
MSAPHVAGAWAVIRQADPGASIDDILLSLRLTGTSVNDLRSGGTVTDMRRINLGQALAHFALPQPEVATTPAAGSMIDLGDVAVGGMGAASAVEVSNSGDGVLNLSCEISGANAGSYSLLACPPVVAAAASDDVSLRCDPQAIGELGATLTLNTNDLSEPLLTYSLVCTGMGVEIATTPQPATALNFGGVLYNSQSGVLNVQVSNSGNLPLSLGCSLAGSNPDQFSITACQASVAAGMQVQVGVRCLPTSAGSKTASLQLSSNDSDESLLEFPLNCTGLSPEIGSDPVAGSEVDFGSVEVGLAGSTHIILLANSGDGLLTLGCSLGGANPETFNLVQCPASIAAGNAANVQLRCQPQATSSFLAELQVSSNDSDEPLLGFDLKCLGIPPEIVFTDNFEENSN